MNGLLNKIKQGTHSLACLNSAQFLGALNDNIFKLVVVFLLIQKEGADQANSILSAVGALFVAPFLLFSSTAGVLADRYSKQTLLMSMKIAEMVLMGLAILAFATESTWGSYALLFILATHSALFGPSKYSIIPEIVPSDKIAKANGLVTSFTYLAIITGTFLASFLTEITHRRFVLIALFCLLVATGGFLSTLGIKKTKPQHPEKKFNPLFIREIFYTLRFAKSIKHLHTAIYGAAFFLFIGAYTQLNIIPYAIQDLHRDDITGGYLFLAVALGIACGSLIAGRASKKQIELGLSCVAGIGISLLLFLLPLLSHHLTSVVVCLVLLGMCGGIFVVPFDTFVQTVSPDEKRGQIIGAVNFLSFVGVLLASLALYFFSNVLHLTAGQGFAVVGFVTLVTTAFFAARLSDLVLTYSARRFVKPFFKLNIQNEQTIPFGSYLILQKATPLKALLLLSVKPNIHFLIPGKPSKLYNLLYSVHRWKDRLPQPQEGIIYCICLTNQTHITLPPGFHVTIERSKKRSYTIDLLRN
jgi:acyl-[acyl-carrier-protein]-phospholipid O-acyltransferase / long-chain-fatty-acid--[acyl-carrier-protein] ligase